MKPNYKRPTLWAVNSYLNSNYRMRIIYPNGEAEWISEWVTYVWHDRPCWNRYGSKSAKEAVQKMKRHDKKFKRKTLFLGNL